MTVAGEEVGKTTVSSGEAGPHLPGGAARQNIYEETVRAAEGVQETIPPDKVGPLCPVRHPMFREGWNGVSIIRGTSNTSPGVHVWTDASGWLGQWFQRQRPGCSYNGLVL